MGRVQQNAPFFVPKVQKLCALHRVQCTLRRPHNIHTHSKSLVEASGVDQAR